jgi:ribosomal peptide maturation radical SAM protein 1
MAYRKKPGADVYGMLCRLSRRYPLATRFQASDNILSPTYFKDLIPQLKEKPLEVELFYSVKSNLTRRQLRALAEAGIWYIQPGIESLSSDVLRLMNKGVSALQNVFLLKASREYGIVVYWNNLIRLPDESTLSYVQMAEWIPQIVHLRPPYGGAPKIECHRFSPYHDQAPRWTSAIRPQPWYSDLFPSEVFDLDRLAYYFEADWKDTLEGSAYQQMVDTTLEWVRIWREAPELPQLRIQPRHDGGIDIEDTRRSDRGSWQLDPFEAAVYAAIDAPTPLHRIVRVVAERSDTEGSEPAVQGVLVEFERAGLALREGDRYLAIALAADTVDPSLAVRRGRQKSGISQQRKNNHPPTEVQRAVSSPA